MWRVFRLPPHPDPTAIELSNEVLFFSLSSTKWRRGPGRGGARLSAGTSRAGRERPFLLLLMQKSIFGSWRRIEKRGPSSPRPSPPLQGREGENPRFILVSSLNSMAVHPDPLPQGGEGGEGIELLPYFPRPLGGEG